MIKENRRIAVLAKKFGAEKTAKIIIKEGVCFECCHKNYGKKTYDKIFESLLKEISFKRTYSLIMQSKNLYFILEFAEYILEGEYTLTRRDFKMLAEYRLEEFCYSDTWLGILEFLNFVETTPEFFSQKLQKRVLKVINDSNEYKALFDWVDTHPIVPKAILLSFIRKGMLNRDILNFFKKRDNEYSEYLYPKELMIEVLCTLSIRQRARLIHTVDDLELIKNYFDRVNRYKLKRVFMPIYKQELQRLTQDLT